MGRKVVFRTRADKKRQRLGLMMLRREKWWWVSGGSALACRRMSCEVVSIVSRPFASSSSSRVPLRQAETGRLFRRLVDHEA